MTDHLFDKDYQAARQRLNGDLAKLAGDFSKAFGNAFKVLNRIEYSAPWKSRPSRARC